MHIRPAQTADAEQLLATYAYYVKNTAISFEYAVPSLEAFQNRIRTTLKQYPYLVLESENAVYGYAYAAMKRLKKIAGNGHIECICLHCVP